MKKIFTFFAALACVMSMSAKVIYLKPNSNWQQANATFWVHAWGAGDKDVKMTPVEGDPTVYQAEVGESTSVIFMRRDPSKDASNVWDLWNRMGNLAIPADKNCCAINEGEWTQEKEDASAHVTWSVYTPSTGGEDPDPGTGGDEPKPEVGYYITGNSELVGGDGWKANEIQMLENEGTYTHTFEQLQAGVEYKMKVTDGSWSKHWGYTALQIVPEGVVKDGDGNIVFKMAEASDLAVAFDGTNITLTGTFAEIELPTVVYNVTVPEGTKACYIAGAMNGWSQEEMTKVDDTHYTISIKGATTEMKYKYCSGPSWDYEEVTADGGKVEDRVYSENDVVAKWKAVYAPGEEPGEEPGEDPEPSTGVTYNVTVPVGTNACYIAGEMNAWSHTEMTKVDDTHYTLTVADATTAMKYKYCSGPSWDYVEMRADGVTDVQDRTYSENDVVEAWKAVYEPAGENPEPKPITIALAGDMNEWNTEANLFVLSEDSLTASLTIALEVQTYAFKVVLNGEWFGNQGEMTRDNCTGWTFEKLSGEETNARIVADVAGEYVFTWSITDNKLSVSYPSLTPTAVEDVDAATRQVKFIYKGQVVVRQGDKIYNMLGQEVK